MKTMFCIVRFIAVVTTPQACACQGVVHSMSNRKRKRKRR